MCLKQFCKRDRKSFNWTECDTLLLVLACICIVTSVVFASNFHHKEREHHEKHHKPKGGYFQTSCQVDTVDLTNKMIECSKNEYGEWCEFEQEDEKDDEEEDHSRKKRSEHEEKRHFPCMKIGVRFRQQKKHGGHEIRAILHHNWTHASNFPSCSENSCRKLSTENLKEIKAQKEKWERHHKKKDDFTCYYNKDNMKIVVLNIHSSWFNSGFHAAFWPCFVGIICIIVIIIRRCCLCCKKVYPEEHKTDLTKTENGMVQPGQEYPVSKVMPEDDGMPAICGPPPTYDGRLPGSVASLSSSPPAYEIIVRPTDLVPPYVPPYTE